jgi:hypothetical protein
MSATGRRRSLHVIYTPPPLFTPEDIFRRRFATFRRVSRDALFICS